MTTDIEKLDDAERQKLADDLHALGVKPSILQGSGSPAHLAMLGSTINDMRQVVSIQSTNLNRLFGVVDRAGVVLDKQFALIEKMIDWFDPHKHAEHDRLPGERGH
jgi:hypothetical protein